MLYTRYIKRAMDVVAALAGLLLASPVMVMIGAAVLASMGMPVLFRQRRPGRHERPIWCVKFRTMTGETGPDGRLLPDAQRLTRVGALLRRTSLDELPQLLSILTGHLSFIGPRPLLEEYLPYYTSDEHRRHSVRPGLTGWAQIHGRNDLSFDERLRLDLWYVDHFSWQLDLRIFLATLWVVLMQRGVKTESVTLSELRESHSSGTLDATKSHTRS